MLFEIWIINGLIIDFSRMVTDSFIELVETLEVTIKYILM